MTVPNYVGRKIDLVFPITTASARSNLLVHQTWIKHFPHWHSSDLIVISLFLSFLHDESECPPFLKLAQEQEKHKHEQGLMHKEIVQEVENDIGNLQLAEDFEEDSGDLFILLSHLPVRSSGKVTEWEFNIGTDHDKLTR